MPEETIEWLGPVLEDCATAYVPYRCGHPEANRGPQAKITAMVNSMFGKLISLCPRFVSAVLVFARQKKFFVGAGRA